MHIMKLLYTVIQMKNFEHDAFDAQIAAVNDLKTLLILK